MSLPTVLPGGKETGHSTISASDFSLPVTAKITWNTRTGEVQYFINNEIQAGWTQKVQPSGDAYRVYFGGMGYCSTVKVTNITLTSEPAKK